MEAAVVDAVALIEAGAARLADRLPDVDALIARLLEGADEFGVEHYHHPAILAAVGRTDEAQRALERYRQALKDPKFDAYCDQLGAFFLAGATVPRPSEHPFPKAPAPFATTIQMAWSDIPRDTG